MGGRIPGAHREGKGVSRGACWTVHPDPLQLGERGEQAEQAVGATDRTRIQAHGGQGMHRRKEGMMIRVTYVAEYENELDAPEIKAGMDCMDGKLVAVQFSDALREAEEDRKSHESLRDVAQELIDD